MKRGAILSAAAVMAAFAARGAANEIVTGGGVRIAPERVYVNAREEGADVSREWRDATLAFSHGNATLRLRMDNLRDYDQSASVTIPLGVIDGAARGAQKTVRIHAALDLAPGEEAVCDIPVPMVGRLALIAGRIVVEDVSGAARDTSALALLGYSGDDYSFSGPLRSLFNPSGCVVADDMARAPAPAPLRLAVSDGAAGIGFAEACDKRLRARFARPAPVVRAGATLVETPDFSRFRRWQDMSGYDMVAIAAADWPGMPETFKAILPDWVAGGGILATVGMENPPLAPGNYGLGKVFALDAAAPGLDALAKALVSAMDRRSLATSPLECDVKASDAVAALRSETPFSAILLVLLAFCILGGPVLVVTLARRNSRLSLLWIFPSLAVAFSIVVTGVIVCAKGIYPELRQFVHTIRDEKAGKAVTICDHVVIAPFTLRDDIRLDARHSTVEYMSGDPTRCGGTVIYTGDEFVFRDGWAPTLWPVVFRTVTVRDIADAPSAPPIPLSGRLQEHVVIATEERRGAQ